MKTIVIAPHPDDESLGVGGTLLRRKAEGGCVAWLIVTMASEKIGWSKDQLDSRRAQIDRVSKSYNFDAVFQLGYPTAELDFLPMTNLVSSIGKIFREFEPNEVFVPHPSDVHSDHRVVFDAAVSCTKWFRYPSVKRLLAYETISETEFGVSNAKVFTPNLFVNIESFFQKKLEIIKLYESEIAEFPFPRSEIAIKALANFRGATSGYQYAEAFELLRARE
jgi:LmbE family N-acetylglucosaminyl deacetylase